MHAKRTSYDLRRNLRTTPPVHPQRGEDNLLNRINGYINASKIITGISVTVDEPVLASYICDRTEFVVNADYLAILQTTKMYSAIRRAHMNQTGVNTIMGPKYHRG